MDKAHAMTETFGQAAFAVQKAPVLIQEPVGAMERREAYDKLKQNPLNRFATAITVHPVHLDRVVQMYRLCLGGIAYLDAVIVTARLGAIYDPTEAKLGDGFERCYKAHEAIEPHVPFVYVHHLEVLPELQNNKVGTRLLEWFENYVRVGERGARSIWLCANSFTHQDTQLHKFYTNRGYQQLHDYTCIFYKKLLPQEPTP